MISINYIGDKDDQAETNEIRGWSAGIVDILLKMPDIENRPFKGHHIDSYFA
jgi:hypothetical protein